MHYDGFPHHPPPHHGESLHGWVRRLAHGMDAPLRPVLEAARLVDLGKGGSPPPWTALLVGDDRAAHAGAAVGIAAADLRAMTLRRYDGTAWTVSRHEGPRSTHDLATRGLALLSSSRWCPSCAAERPGVWLLAWRLPWTYGCARHRVLLAHRCPGCRRPGVSGSRQEPTPVLAFPDEEVDPTRCTNGVPRADGSPRPCGHDPASVPADPLDVDASALQARLDLRTDGVHPHGWGLAGDPVGWFNDLRAVAGLAVACRAVRGGAPTAVRHRARHDRALAHHPSLAAAALRVAEPVVDAADEGAAADLLAPLVAAAKALGDDGLRILDRDYPLTARTARAVRLAVRRSGRFTVAAGLGNSTVDPPVVAGAWRTLGADAVAQLLPDGDYDLLFADLFPPRSRLVGRAFCAVAVAKAVVRRSWGDAATAIGQAGDGTGQRWRRQVWWLGQRGDLDRFRVALDRLFDSYGSRQPTDHGARRRALADVRAVPHAVWADACRGSGTHPTPDGARLAAVWVWEHAGGDPRVSPPAVAATVDAPLERWGYRRFRERLHPDAAAVLHRFADDRYSFPATPPIVEGTAAA